MYIDFVSPNFTEFVTNGHYYVEVCSLHTHFLESFCHDGCWIFPLLFRHLLRGSGFLSFILLMGGVALRDFWMLNRPCICGITSTWSYCITLLMFYWIWFANFENLVEDFCTNVHQGYWAVMLFSCVLVWFWYQGNAGLVKWVQKCFVLFYFVGDFRMISINSSNPWAWNNFPFICFLQFLSSTSCSV